MEAKDLRLMVAYLKISNELERIFTRSRTFIRDFPSAIADIDKDFILEYAVPLQKTSVITLQNDLAMSNADDPIEIENPFKNTIIEESNNDGNYSAYFRFIRKFLISGVCVRQIIAPV